MIAKFIFTMLLLSVPASAQVASSTNFTLEKSVVSSGGSTSSSANFTLTGTIGQPAAGPGSGPTSNVTGGFWKPELAPTAAPAEISGRVLDSAGRGIRGVQVTAVSDTGETALAVTNSLGRYRIEGLTAGRSYIVSAAAKRHTFADPVRLVDLAASIAGLDFQTRPTRFDPPR